MTILRKLIKFWNLFFKAPGDESVEISNGTLNFTKFLDSEKLEYEAKSINTANHSVWSTDEAKRANSPPKSKSCLTINPQ